MNVYLTSLGCRLNEAELQTWSHDFVKMGLRITTEILDANLMVINTCAVTGEAARKSRQSIRRLHRKNPTAKLIVTGCYASLDKNEAESLLGVDLIVSNQQKDQLANKAKELLEWDSMPFAATEPEEAALFVRNRERAFIKVQDGCRYRCTYCIVTIARGEEKSRSIDDILVEIKQLQIEGVQEIVITGVHVGGYGSDIDTSLYQLVVAILEQTTIPRIRFASVEPWDLHDQFFELFKNKRLMPHMHLPIQSGSDRILKKMSRRCNSKMFLELLKKARQVVPEFNITSDIIVGFPSETEDDFKQSLEMVEQSDFGHVHIFSFSAREGTKAARLTDQIDTTIKKNRSQKMHQLCHKTKLVQAKKILGKKLAVLWEGHGKKLENNTHRFFGYTPNYQKVQVILKSELDITNQIIDCEIKDINDEGILIGKLVTNEKVKTKNILVQSIT